MFFKSDIQTEAIELIFCLYSLRFRDQECADKKIKIRANFCREEKKGTPTVICFYRCRLKREKANGPCAP